MIRTREVLSGISYSLYVIFHPFKGFWNLKKEKRGNLPAAIVLLMLLVLVLMARSQITGWLFRIGEAANTNLLTVASSILLLFFLWCVSNWCITTLVDGEGNLRDIFIATAFSLTPLILIHIPMIALSHLFVLDESAFYFFFDTLSILWFVFLVLIGIMTTHQFTMSKTLVTVLIAIVGMAVMVIVALLFFALIQQFINFCILFLQEWNIRFFRN